MAAGFDRLQGRADRFVVGEGLVDRGPFVAEFVEIAAGRESSTFATDDNRAQISVRVEFGHDRREPPPHGGVDGVEFAGAEKRDGGNATVTVEQDVRHDYFRRTTPISLSTYFSYTGSVLPFFILRMKYFSKPILARCTHLPFLNQLTLRGGI